MTYQIYKKTVVFIALLIASTLTPFAQAAKLADIFNGAMLGTTQRYFESVAGIPRESFMDIHTFNVGGCQVQATITGGEVTALRLELGPKCKADLSSFISDYSPKARKLPFGLFAKPLTFGEFAKAAGPMRYFADCLSGCGNGYDPSVYALWHGPHATQFLEALLEVKLVGEAVLTAAGAWQNHMERAMGEEYVMETRFNCDDHFSADAAQIFEKIEVTAITLGHDLKPPECS